jgi:Dullard-like phosphatase family protein
MKLIIKSEYNMASRVDLEPIPQRSPRYFSNSATSDKRLGALVSKSKRLNLVISDDIIDDNSIQAPLTLPVEHSDRRENVLGSHNSKTPRERSVFMPYSTLTSKSEIRKGSSSLNTTPKSVTPKQQDGRAFVFPENPIIKKSITPMDLLKPGKAVPFTTPAKFLKKIGTLTANETSNTASKSNRILLTTVPTMPEHLKPLTTTNAARVQNLRKEPFISARSARTESRKSLERSKEVESPRPETKTESRAETKTEEISSFVTNVSSNSSQNDQSNQDKIYRDHLFNTFQALKFVRKLQPVDMTLLKNKQMNLPKRQGYENKKTLIFDLDETLVHCVDASEKHTADVIITVRFPNGQSVKAGINIRPYVLDCLVEANKFFEVIVFTASHRCYADAVLDYIDPTRTLIHHRLYRENCLNIQGVHIKDLRILQNRLLKNLIIVDNAAYSFGYQIDNGIPIIAWYKDRQDKELRNLMDFMKVLSDNEDVREVLRRTFRLNTFYTDYMNEFLSTRESI